MITYYNQNNYKNVSYWTAAHPNATIASAGCGLCAASMMLSVFGIKVDPPKMAEISAKCGARVETGTDMIVLSNYLKSQYKLNLSKYDDVKKLEKDIRSGAVAIANVGGDRTGYKGVFSSGGHYIVIYGIKDGNPIIYDSGFYSGKYVSEYRKARVMVGDNHQLYASWAVLDKDCSNRSPRYYVFTKEGMTLTVEQAKAIIKEKAGLSDKTIQYLWSYRFGDDLLIKIAMAMK